MSYFSLGHGSPSARTPYTPFQVFPHISPSQLMPNPPFALHISTHHRNSRRSPRNALCAHVNPPSYLPFARLLRYKALVQPKRAISSQPLLATSCNSSHLILSHTRNYLAPTLATPCTRCFVLLRPPFRKSLLTRTPADSPRSHSSNSTSTLATTLRYLPVAIVPLATSHPSHYKSPHTHIPSRHKPTHSSYGSQIPFASHSTSLSFPPHPSHTALSLVISLVIVPISPQTPPPKSLSPSHSLRPKAPPRILLILLSPQLLALPLPLPSLSSSMPNPTPRTTFPHPLAHMRNITQNITQTTLPTLTSSMIQV